MMALDDIPKSSSMRSQYEQLVTAERALDSRESELNHRTDERPLDVEQRRELLNAQHRATEVYNTLSRSPPAPNGNESPIYYRTRLASALQDHSAQWRYVNLFALARSSPSAFANAEQEIFEAATKNALDPLDRWRPDSNTRLRERVEVQSDGTKISFFHGSPAVVLASFNGNNRSCAVTGWGPRFPQRRVK
jgi:hypothetical protein